MLGAASEDKLLNAAYQCIGTMHALGLSLKEACGATEILAARLQVQLALEGERKP